MKFQPGEMVVTKSISDGMNENPSFHFYIFVCLDQHLNGDWGDACAEDKASNDAALKGGERLLSVYKSEEFGVIWIVTEADRSSTTVLRPSEY